MYDMTIFAGTGIRIKEALDRFCGDEKLYYDFLFKYPEDDTLSVCRRYLEDKNYEAVFYAVHSFKGASLNLGIETVSECCTEVCSAIKANRISDIASLLDSADEEFQRASRLIEAFRKTDKNNKQKQKIRATL